MESFLSLLFSVYRSSFLNPFTYFRLIGHVFGHADWEHFLGNITLILVVGPLLEEKLFVLLKFHSSFSILRAYCIKNSMLNQSFLNSYLCL